jgi:membrane-associated phospholipid phosphatase
MGARVMSRGVVMTVFILAASSPAPAQSLFAPVSPVSEVAIGGDAAAPAGNTAAESGTISRFVRDVGGDYKHFFSTETAIWLGAGGGAALAVHQGDQSIADWATEHAFSLSGGNLYGSQLFQVPVAIAWWVVGSAAHSEKQATVGRDLLRAQISVFSWTYAIKFAADRTRPNGDPRGFPSGHATTSFATAAVLQEHFGWKVGVPAFAMAAYTGFTRVTDNQHWASDVVFGAALGIASGRSVTLHLRDSRVTLSPVPMPGGIGVSVRAGGRG